MRIKENNVNKLFLTFLLVHVFIWTLIPSILNQNLPLDTIEALAWGSNLDWGFDKHPPLSAFAVEIFYQVFGNQDWVYYLLSQLFVIFSFFVVFKCSEYFLQNKIYSLVSVFLLEGIYFYNFTTPEFNVNVCQLPFWALTVLFCWKGFKDNKIYDWLLFGVFAALGVLSKYLFIYLLIAMDVFFLYMILKRKIDLKCLVSLITFILVLLPHLIWLVENNYSTITYALHRTGLGEPNFLNHFTHPFIFLGKQIGILIPFFIMFLFIISKLKAKINFKDKKLIFLITINFVPLILIFLTSMIAGVKIRTMWMTPFYLFFGIFAVYLFQKSIKLNKIKYFMTVFLILFFISPATYLYVSITKEQGRVDYPGKEIANIIQTEWDSTYKDIPIGYVTPDEWHAGNLSYHLKDRPKLSPKKQFQKLDNFFLSFIQISSKPFLCENDTATRESTYMSLRSDLQSNIEMSGFTYKKINNLHACLILIIYKT